MNIIEAEQYPEFIKLPRIQNQDKKMRFITVQQDSKFDLKKNVDPELYKLYCYNVTRFGVRGDIRMKINKTHELLIKEEKERMIKDVGSGLVPTVKARQNRIELMRQQRDRALTALGSQFRLRV